MAVQGRPYDSLYDQVYTVSGARDHFRQQTVAGGFMLTKAPEYAAMFSELPHFPATTYTFKNSDKVPSFVDRAYHPSPTTAAHLAAQSDPALVTGTHRPKFFRRPLLAMADSGGPIIRAAPHERLAPLPAPPPFQATRTYGTQSDYREGEAQTSPWSPDFVIPEIPSVKAAALAVKHHTEGPELLYLRDLKFGDGLPPGLQEVRRVEKMREKRAFEATLPPIDDAAQLPLRQKMIEEWEAAEWQEREEEIAGVQHERLVLLEHALQVREEEFETEAMDRVEARKAFMLEQQASKFAGIQSSRIKTMRQLIEARKYVEKPRQLQKLSIVEKYVNYASSVYAPMQRDGKFPESKPQGKEIETEGYAPTSLSAITELAAFLPARTLNPKIAVPQRPAKLNYAQRHDMAIQKDLKAVNELLDSAKATQGRGYGDCWPAPLDAKGKGEGLSAMSNDTMGALAGAAKTRRMSTRAPDRPSTPELPPPPAVSVAGGQDAAVVLLQRLLRGRAAQNAMYEGKMRRLELIQELRCAEVVPPAPTPRTALAARVDLVIGSAIAELLVALADPDDERRTSRVNALCNRQGRAAAAAAAAAAAQRAAAAALERERAIEAAKAAALAELAASRAAAAAEAKTLADAEAAALVAAAAEEVSSMDQRWEGVWFGGEAVQHAASVAAAGQRQRRRVHWRKALSWQPLATKAADSGAAASSLQSHPQMVRTTIRCTVHRPNTHQAQAQLNAPLRQPRQQPGWRQIQPVTAASAAAPAAAAAAASKRAGGPPIVFGAECAWPVHLQVGVSAPPATAMAQVAPTATDTESGQVQKDGADVAAQPGSPTDVPVDVVSAAVEPVVASLAPETATTDAAVLETAADGASATADVSAAADFSPAAADEVGQVEDAASAVKVTNMEDGTAEVDAVKSALDGNMPPADIPAAVVDVTSPDSSLETASSAATPAEAPAPTPAEDASAESAAAQSSEVPVVVESAPQVTAPPESASAPAAEPSPPAKAAALVASINPFANMPLATKAWRAAVNFDAAAAEAVAASRAAAAARAAAAVKRLAESEAALAAALAAGVGPVDDGLDDFTREQQRLAARRATVSAERKLQDAETEALRWQVHVDSALEAVTGSPREAEEALPSARAANADATPALTQPDVADVSDFQHANGVDSQDDPRTVQVSAASLEVEVSAGGLGSSRQQVGPEPAVETSVASASGVEGEAASAQEAATLQEEASTASAVDRSDITASAAADVLSEGLQPAASFSQEEEAYSMSDSRTSPHDASVEVDADKGRLGSLAEEQTDLTTPGESARGDAAGHFEDQPSIAQLEHAEEADFAPENLLPGLEQLSEAHISGVSQQESQEAEGQDESKLAEEASAAAEPGELSANVRAGEEEELAAIDEDAPGTDGMQQLPGEQEEDAAGGLPAVDSAEERLAASSSLAEMGADARSSARAEPSDVASEGLGVDPSFAVPGVMSSVHVLGEASLAVGLRAGGSGAEGGGGLAEEASGPALGMAGEQVAEDAQQLEFVV